MIPPEPLLVILVQLVNRIPMPPPPSKRKRGHPIVYPDRLFLQALVIMIVRHLHKVHELLAALDEHNGEMQSLRTLLTQNGQYPSRRTWERRLKAIPETLPAQIGCLGRYLVMLIQPWQNSGRAGAIDSTVLRAAAGCGIRKIVNKASCRTPRLIPKPPGPNPVGMGGSMVGNYT